MNSSYLSPTHFSHSSTYIGKLYRLAMIVLGLGICLERILSIYLFKELNLYFEGIIGLFICAWIIPPILHHRKKITNIQLVYAAYLMYTLCMLITITGPPLSGAEAQFILMGKVLFLSALSSLIFIRLWPFLIFAVMTIVLLSTVHAELYFSSAMMKYFFFMISLVLIFSGILVWRRAVRFGNIYMLVDQYEKGPIGVLQLTRQGKLLYVNQKGKEFFPSLVQGRLNTAHPIILFAMQAMYEDPKADNFVINELQVGGHYFKIEAVLHGQDNLISLFVQNVTHGKKVEGILREREELYQIMVEGTNEALVMVDTEGKIGFVNHQFSKLFGFEKEEIIGEQAAGLLVDNSDPEVVRNRLERRKQGMSEVYEARQMTKSGEELWTLISASPYHNEEGEVAGTIAAITDLSLLKRAQEQLEERNRQMDMFIYKATHDIKGPLASVKGILGLALEYASNEQVSKYINMAITSADRLDNAVVDLLRVTRINNMELDIKPLNIDKLVGELLQSLGYGKEVGNSHVLLEIEEDTQLNSDENALITIFQNLLLNGIKYKKEGQKDHFVRVKVIPYRAGIQIIVEDNGEGIRKDIQAKVFNMFYRGNKQSKGTGLGLYLVRKSVEKLGGEITLKSIYLENTTFTVYLPNKPLPKSVKASETIAIPEKEKML